MAQLHVDGTDRLRYQPVDHEDNSLACDLRTVWLKNRSIGAGVLATIERRAYLHLKSDSKGQAPSYTQMVTY